MISVRPSYQELNKTYYSDTCKPLVAAWKKGRVTLEAWARSNYPATYKMESGVLPCVSSVGYWDATSQQDWGLNWHRNEGIEITFLETGTMPFSLANDQYIIHPNEVTITRPWQPHKLGDPYIGVGKLYWVILDVGVRCPHQEWNWPPWITLTEKDLSELTGMLRQNEQPIWKTNQEIGKCFQKIGNVITCDKSGEKESWIAIYINELLMHFLEFFRNGPFQWDESLVNSSRTVQLFIKDLRNSYFEPWTLERMAEYCGLKVTRFVHYFRQLTNMTPMNYLTHVRLETAANLLVSQHARGINEICYDCGFTSSQYFSTVFRKQYGCSPTAYRYPHLKN